MGLTDGVNRPSPLESQLEAKTRDLDWTLAHFTFVANVTTLASECDIAHSPLMSVASCRSLPKQVLAFMGDSPELLATYAAFLADPGSEIDLVVNESQRTIVEDAFEVTCFVSHWQMVFRGDPADLKVGRAVELVDNDLPTVQALAKAEKASLEIYTPSPLAHGPAFGIWDRRKLVAMGMTGVCLPGAAQIGNIITRREYRRQGYASEIVSALARSHLVKGRRVFAVVEQTNISAIALLENLGFAIDRAMYVMHCALAEG